MKSKIKGEYFIMEIIGSFILAIFQSILFYEKQIGISMLIFTLVGNGIIFCILKKKNKIVNSNGFLLMIPILLLSSSYLIFANKTFYIANIFILIILHLLMFVIITNKKDYLKNYISKTIALFSNTIFEYNDSIEYVKDNVNLKNTKKIDKDKLKKFLQAVFIVFIVVGIVIILLSSADSLFANIFPDVRSIFDNINLVNILNLSLRLLFIVIFSILFLNLILKLKIEENDDFEYDNSMEKNINKNPFTLKLLLISLNIIYFIFCCIQISSLFAKINITANFNYAEYARTGFFELMFVSFINFIIIIISNKQTENKNKFIRTSNIFLVIFTVIIVISSMYRMHMYELEFGLTYLRAFVFILLFTEILLFIPTVLYIFKSNFDFIKWCMTIILSIYCISNFINIEKIIITKNINRDGDIDYSYISKIATEDSYDILEEKFEQDITDEEKLSIIKVLFNIANTSNDATWQEFNISKFKLKEKNIDVKSLRDEKMHLNELIAEHKIILEKIANNAGNRVYSEKINENEEYFVTRIDAAMSSELWSIEKLTHKGSKYALINTIDVTGASKIKFFENGLGFLENPTNIYCESSELLITHDSGKTFTKIDFPIGEFTLSNYNKEEWQNCYDYFHLPTKLDDGTLVVLASGGYQDEYNKAKIKAKYISKDNGYSWEFVEEVRCEK